jgi:hypothetical protein
MGADLIGYFAVGPRELDLSRRDTAIAEADRRLDWLLEICNLLNGPKPYDNATLCSLLAQSPNLTAGERNSESDEIDLYQLTIELNRLVDMIDNFENLTGEVAVDRFLLGGRTSRPPTSSEWHPMFRDSAVITAPESPDRIIVFAGERTWGDTPDGGGFHYLAEAGFLGITAAFGIHVCASFFSFIVKEPQTHRKNKP